jgi:hypothetical protein
MFYLCESHAPIDASATICVSKCEKSQHDATRGPKTRRAMYHDRDRLFPRKSSRNTA